MILGPRPGPKKAFSQKIRKKYMSINGIRQTHAALMGKSRLTRLLTSTKRPRKGKKVW